MAAVFLQQDCTLIRMKGIVQPGSRMMWYEFYLMNPGLLPWAEEQLFCLPKVPMKDWSRKRDFPLGKNSSELIVAGCPRYLLEDD